MSGRLFREQVAEKKEILETENLRGRESELAAKRAAWAEDWLETRRMPVPATPRGAFEMFIRDYLGAALEDVPVVLEDDERIVWHAANPCDTLEACRDLGRDTRDVCRALYEKPVQSLVSQLDPELRFVRNYGHIRPEAGECEEAIVRVSFHDLMGLALEEARLSLAEGNKGYGAVVARGSEILARAHDTVEKTGDPSHHGEVNAIRAAVKTIGDPNLSGCILVSTCEPCPMCSSLAVWANVTSIVYGASIDATGELGRARIQLTAQEVVSASSATVEVIPGVRATECLDLYR